MFRDRRNARWIVVMIAALPLGACISGGGQPPPLVPLAEDRGQPVLALFEHVLTDHFALYGANAPTTCAPFYPSPLSAEQEAALIGRFIRLAPASRCTATSTGPVDAITGGPACVVQVYNFSCSEEGECTGWALAPQRPATRYAMRFENGAWRFTADLRRIAGQ